MDEFYFFQRIINFEKYKFNLNFMPGDFSEISITDLQQLDFNNPYKRCAFLHRYGTISLVFIKACIEKFILECPNSLLLLRKFYYPGLKFCSLSAGPGFDFIAFLSTLSFFDETLKIDNVRILNKHGSWKHSFNYMLELIQIGELGLDPRMVCVKGLLPQFIYGKQTDILMQGSRKLEYYIGDADIIFMFRIFNLPQDSEFVETSLLDLLETVKAGSLLFCIDTKPSVDVISNQLLYFDGQYLLPPTFLFHKLPAFTDDFSDEYGPPVLSGRGSFFVWQKGSHSPNQLNKDDLVFYIPSLRLASFDSDSNETDQNIIPEFSDQNITPEFSDYKYDAELEDMRSSLTREMHTIVLEEMISDINEAERIGAEHAKSNSVINSTAISTEQSESNFSAFVESKTNIRNPTNTTENLQDSSLNLSVITNLLNELEHFLNDLKLFMSKINLNQQCSCSQTCCQQNGLGSNNIASPSIVIPLPNLSNETILQIVSLMQQNSS